METESWVKSVIDKLEPKIKDINPSDFRFYNISHLPLLAKKTAEYHQNCSICASKMEIIEQLIDDLPAVLTENAKNRKHFEKKKHQIEKHLRNKHACRFPGYYAALGSLLGLIFGIIFASFTMFVIKMPLFNKLSLIGLAISLISGRFIGDYIDKKYFKNKLQL